ncbi:hypothetical protein AVEN_178005-1 [Araneus ventricosus]|uniref:Uncharacterized protein n=1 Tax=Araneus ventricosus TaxID=182803 RepID=A0A4Y2LZ84_ARAVE|nr:hypothetical protein AVEN_178005-1 [Araneus ventricosus]
MDKCRRFIVVQLSVCLIASGLISILNNTVLQYYLRSGFVHGPKFPPSQVLSLFPLVQRESDRFRPTGGTRIDPYVMPYFPPWDRKESLLLEGFWGGSGKMSVHVRTSSCRVRALEGGAPQQVDLGSDDPRCQQLEHCTFTQSYRVCCQVLEPSALCACPRGSPNGESEESGDVCLFSDPNKRASNEYISLIAYAFHSNKIIQKIIVSDEAIIQRFDETKPHL